MSNTDKMAVSSSATTEMVDSTDSTYDSSSPPAPEKLYNKGVHWSPKFTTTLANGLDTKEAKKRLVQYGPNAFEDKKQSKLMEYLQHYWGPMPAMIWLAILVLFLKHMFFKPCLPDLIMCCVLQFVNANVKHYTQRNAKKAIEALKAKMAPTCFAKRNGNWAEVPTATLVPGDFIQINIGMILPADVRFSTLKGQCVNVEIDQSSLTGESLPTKKKGGDVGFSSTIVKRGEGEALVVGTGAKTEMGKAAKLVSGVKKVSRYDYVLFYVAMYLLVLASVCMSVQFTYSVIQGESVMSALAVCIAILIGALPVAMHVVCLSIMAFGAYRLSKYGAVVSELTAVEELSGMTILCSDKTGTLTYNSLRIIKDKCEGNELFDLEKLFFFSFLGCKRSDKGLDAIDGCITDFCKSEYEEEIYNKIAGNEDEECERKENAQYLVTDFIPFDPVLKRTEATVYDKKTNKSFAVTKGAPQVVLNLCNNVDLSFEENFALRTNVENRINELAEAGYRTLGIAVENVFTKNYNTVLGASELIDRNSSAVEGSGFLGAIDEEKSGEESAVKKVQNFDFVGLLAIADPPRHDTKDVIAAAQNDLDIKVIMITGDQLAIAKEVGGQIGLDRDSFLPAKFLTDFEEKYKDDKHMMEKVFPEIVERVAGFAEVFPEHKYRIVELLQSKGHIVGMTGDGVNDAPALKLSNVGIAVSGATDAARASASMFLQKSGLSVIIFAIMRSKKVFERVKNYIIYRCSTSMRLMGFFFCCTLFVKPQFFLPGYFNDAKTNEDSYNTWRHHYASEVGNNSGAEESNFGSIFGSDGKIILSPNTLVSPRDWRKTCTDPHDDTEECIERNGFQDDLFPYWADLCFESLCDKRGLGYTGESAIDVNLAGYCDEHKKGDNFFAPADVLMGYSSPQDFSQKHTGSGVNPFLNNGDGGDHSEYPYDSKLSKDDLIKKLISNENSYGNKASYPRSKMSKNARTSEYFAYDRAFHEYQSRMYKASQSGVNNPFANAQFPSLHKCVEKLRTSDVYVSNFFATPTIVVIVLALLNDFTVLSIAFDHVEISSKPDEWRLVRNISIGSVIGMNTLFWSLVMFLFMLSALNPLSYACKHLNICLSYPEVLTGAFLQLSLCGRLARTNARTESWFFNLSLHRSVVYTMSFSIIMAVLFGFTWPFCNGKGSCSPDMKPLDPKMVAIIILFQIPVHFFRDIMKLIAYKLFDKYDAKKDAQIRVSGQKKEMDVLCTKVVREELGFRDFYVAGKGRAYSKVKTVSSAKQEIGDDELQVVEGVLNKRMGAKKSSKA